MLHRIQLALQDESLGKLCGLAEVEVDETFIGGKARNMHLDKRTASNHQEATGVKGQDSRSCYS